MGRVLLTSGHLERLLNAAAHLLLDARQQVLRRLLRDPPQGLRVVRTGTRVGSPVLRTLQTLSVSGCEYMPDSTHCKVLLELLLGEGSGLWVVRAAKLDQRFADSLADLVPRVLAVLAEVVAADPVVDILGTLRNDRIVENHVELGH